MKKPILFLNVFIVLIVISLFSCKKDEGLTSLTLSSPVTEADAGLEEGFRFQLVGNDGENYTRDAVYFADGVEITDNIFLPEDAGLFKITAKYNDITSNELNVTAVNNLTGITLTCKPVGLVGERYPFTLVSSYGTDVSEKAEYYVNGNLVEGEVFYKIPNADSFEVYAKYITEQSETKNISVTASNYTTKVLVEDYTGAWCQYCPRVAHKLEAAVENNSNIIPVAVHDDEEMNYEYVKQMESYFGVTGFPTAKINRINRWEEAESEFDAFTENSVGLGLGINSVKSGNDIEINIKVAFDLDYTEELKLIVYLLEDSLIYNQSNSTEYYGGGNPIVGFVHDNVLRKAFTEVLGDVIESSQTVAGNTYTRTFNVEVPSSVKDDTKLSIVAFVVKGDTKETINVQSADMGVNQDFD